MLCINAPPLGPAERDAAAALHLYCRGSNSRCGHGAQTKLLGPTNSIEPMTRGNSSLGFMQQLKKRFQVDKSEDTRFKKKKSTRCEKQWEFVVLVTGVFLVKSLLIVKKIYIVVKKKKKIN